MCCRGQRSDSGGEQNARFEAKIKEEEMRQLAARRKVEYEDKAAEERRQARLAEEKVREESGNTGSACAASMAAQCH